MVLLTLVRSKVSFSWAISLAFSEAFVLSFSGLWFYISIVYVRGFTPGGALDPCPIAGLNYVGFTLRGVPVSLTYSSYLKSQASIPYELVLSYSVQGQNNCCTLHATIPIFCYTAKAKRSTYYGGVHVFWYPDKSYDVAALTCAASYLN